jgi:hypothetical protein
LLPPDERSSSRDAFERPLLPEERLELLEPFEPRLPPWARSHDSRV